MVLFWNLFLYGSIFFFFLRKMHEVWRKSPVPLASLGWHRHVALVSSVSLAIWLCRATNQFDWRVALEELFQGKVAGTRNRRRAGCSEGRTSRRKSQALVAIWLEEIAGFSGDLVEGNRRLQWRFGCKYIYYVIYLNLCLLSFSFKW